MKFKEYLEKLESLDISKTLLKEDKIVFVISGSSNLKSAALEPHSYSILLFCSNKRSSSDRAVSVSPL